MVEFLSDFELEGNFVEGELARFDYLRAKFKQGSGQYVLQVDHGRNVSFYFRCTDQLDHEAFQGLGLNLLGILSEVKNRFGSEVISALKGLKGSEGEPDKGQCSL